MFYGKSRILNLVKNHDHIPLGPDRTVERINHLTVTQPQNNVVIE